MNLENLYDKLLKNLERHCLSNLPNHPFSEVYLYAVLPPGKLFRPLLACSFFADLNSREGAINQLDNLLSPLSLACSALEVHHTYTLVHDDLPAMDNDDYRRGKLATHKQFGEWQALLVGDGLQGLSYRLLTLVDHPNTLPLLKSATWCLGAKGLIQGQALDLDIENNKSFDEIILIHKLKTARLIQLSLIAGSCLSLNKKIDLRLFKQSLRLGEALGLTFQLLDDLIDLYEDEQEHEAEINPWIHFFQETEVATLRYINQTQEIIKDLELEYTGNFINDYLSKSLKKFQRVCPQKEQGKFNKVIEKLESIN